MNRAFSVGGFALAACWGAASGYGETHTVALADRFSVVAVCDRRSV